MGEHSRDPDDLHGDAIVSYLRISCRRNGSLSVEGHIHDLKYALAMLDNAKDAVRGHHARIASGSKLIVPSRDVGLPELANQG